jgi:hypothetical protein
MKIYPLAVRRKPPGESWTWPSTGRLAPFRYNRGKFSSAIRLTTFRSPLFLPRLQSQISDLNSPPWPFPRASAQPRLTSVRKFTQSSWHFQAPGVQNFEDFWPASFRAPFCEICEMVYRPLVLHGAFLGNGLGVFWDSLWDDLEVP